MSLLTSIKTLALEKDQMIKTLDYKTYECELNRCSRLRIYTKRQVLFKVQFCEGK